MVLALNHHLDSSLVFAPSCRGVDTDFPAVRVHAHRSTQNCCIAQGLLRVVASARDGAAADHGKNGFLIHSIAASMCCWSQPCIATKRSNLPDEPLRIFTPS